MKTKSLDAKKIISKENIFNQPLSQQELINRINTHTCFTRRFVELLIKQSGASVCRSDRRKDGR